jgi:hypothetical protein
MRPPRLRVLALLVGIGLVVGGIGGATYAVFFATTSNTGNSFTAVADWTPPAASASVIARSNGYLAGLLRQGRTYYVYANVTDTGNPASGVTSVTANVSNITTGQTAVPLVSGSYSVNGVSYNYRSAVLTANAGLTAGAKTYTLTLTDAAGNSQTQSGFSVTIDNTAPAGSDIQTANGGSIVGRAETGDRITFTFTEQIDPYSILASWTGASTFVTVRLNNNSGGDRVQIWNSANTAQLPLGQVILGRTDYVTSSRTFTNSTMVQSGTTITITLGTPSGATTTAAGNGTMTWTPSATALDAAGNACSTALVTESGAADREF